MAIELICSKPNSKKLLAKLEITVTKYDTITTYCSAVSMQDSRKFKILSEY